jgi:hypothetical protein
MIEGPAAALALLGALLPGVYTNEEQVEFARAAGKPLPVWVGVEVRRADNGSLRLLTIDAFGQPGAEDQAMTLTPDPDGGAWVQTGRCRRHFVPDSSGSLANDRTEGTCASPAALTAIAPGGLTMVLKDGTPLELLRARPFRCWAAIPRQAPKPDGSTDWWFRANLPLHDRGGRLALETDEPSPQRFSLRMRSVVFPEPPNRPSLVLYVHEEDPVRASSYSWADPEAKRIGINLRRVQASCTLGDGA